MINYGTTEWYQNEIAKSILKQELIEEAINVRHENGEIEVAEFERYGEILADAAQSLERAKCDLKRHIARAESEQ